MSYDETDILKDIADLKAAQKQQRRDIDTLMESSKLMHDMNQNIALLVSGLNHVKDDVTDVKNNQSKTTDEITNIKTKLNDLEHQPADESYRRSLDIKDKILIGVATSGILSAIGAVIALIMQG